MQSKVCHVHVIRGLGIGMVAFIPPISEELFVGKVILEEVSPMGCGHSEISKAVVCGYELLMAPSKEY